MVDKHINIIASLDDLLNQKKQIVKLERKIVFSDDDLKILKSVNDDIINQYIDLLNQSTDDESKNNLLDFLKDNKITLLKITDSNSDYQIAIIKVETDDNHQFYINKNLDLSFGQQSENPRLKRSALINTFLNYNITTKKLYSSDLLFVQNILLNKDSKIEDKLRGCLFFVGAKISDEGFFDNRQPNKKTTDKSNDLDIA